MTIGRSIFGKGPTVRGPSEGGAGQNHSTNGIGSTPGAIVLPIVPGQVALIYWIRQSAPEGDAPVVSIELVSGEEPVQYWVEIPGADTDTAVGQGFLIGDGVYSFQLNASGMMAVDVDPGLIWATGE
jgi:hypothetical protein